MNDEPLLQVIATRDGMRDKFIAAWNHTETILMNGAAVQLSVSPALEPITIKQRKFLHGVVLKQVSEQVQVPIYHADGSPTGRTTRYTIDVWKDYFRDRFLGWKWESKRGFVQDKKTGIWRPAKKATPHRLPISSETLGPAKYAKWCDEIIQHAAVELDVEFVFENDEREQVRYTSKPRARRIQ